MRAPLRRRAVQAVVVALTLQAAFVFFFVFPGHDPEPNDLPVGVVGPPEAARALDRALARTPGSFELERFGSTGEARDAIHDRDVYGAFVVGPSGIERLLYASAASVPAANLLTAVGSEANARVEAVDVVPLDTDDPRGATLNLVVLPLTITAILAALVAFGQVPDLRGPRRLAHAAVAAIGGAALGILIAGTLVGALPGPYLALVGLAALAVLGIALVSGGILRLLGPAATGLPFLVFLMFGNPASGAASAPELLPTPWAQLGEVFPTGAFATGLRNVAYFDGAALATPLIVLAVTAAIGVGLNMLADRRPAPAMPGSPPPA